MSNTIFNHNISFKGLPFSDCAWLNDFVDEVITELHNKCGFEVRKDIEYSFSRSLTRRLGDCYYKQLNGVKFDIKIRINYKIFEAGEYKTIKNVIAHEIIHTFDGVDKHNYKFNNYARMVNAKTLLTVNTRDYNPILADNSKYIVQCCKCSNTFYRIKKSKLITETDKYKCGKCNGNLKLIKGVI